MRFIYPWNSGYDCMIVAVKMRIEPNSKQRRAIDAAIEVNRYAYNFFLTACKLVYESTGGLPSQFDLNNLATRFRHVFPGASDVHSSPLQNTASRALMASQQGIENARKSKKKIKSASMIIDDELNCAMHRPRHRNMGTYNSFSYPRYKSDYRFVQAKDSKGHAVRKLKLGKVPGEIRCYNQHSPINGILKRCTIKRVDIGTHYEYYACIDFERPDTGIISFDRDERWIGIDVGVVNIAALSDGTKYSAERVYASVSNELKSKTSKVGKSLPNSLKRKKARAKHIHAWNKISNHRKVTIENISRDIVDKADVIVMENLSIRGLRSKNSSKHMEHAYNDASLGMLRRRICDKAQGAGRRVLLVDPRGTSQICSNCGRDVRKDLSTRRHECPFCGFTADRDVNAAINILNRGWTGHPSPVIWENSSAPKCRRSTGESTSLFRASC